MHGLPLLPYTLAEPIGKTALKRKGEIAGEQSKAKKKARRNGADPEKAAADVLRRPVALVLPTPAEIAAAWRLLAKADAQPPAAEPPAADPPAADQPTVDPPDPRRVRAMECMFGSQVALDAIDAAYECERHERDLLEAEWGFLDEFDEPLDKEPILDELQVARVRYAQALYASSRRRSRRSSTTARRRARASTAGRAHVVGGYGVRGRGWCRLPL